MAHRIVCISHVTAAGGDAVGHLVAERLGFRYVDDEILELAASHAGVDPEVVASAEHHRGLLARLVDALVSPPEEIESYLTRRPRVYGGGGGAAAKVPTEDLRRLIKDAIVEIAARGDAVIVAHGASLALVGRADVLRVHVTGSATTRAKRLWVENKLLSEDEYAKTIAESDRQRREFLARFYGVQEESPTLYDLVVNTDKIDLEAAVAAIVALADVRRR